jgi:uncharacterized membrane protein
MNQKPTEAKPDEVEPLQQQIRSTHREVQSLKARSDARRTLSERVADILTSSLGSMPFLIFNVVLLIVWVIINIGAIASLKPFDPYPFGLLTMIVSLAGVLLAIIVLISQKRASQIADLRAEIDLQVDMLTERELTKLMAMMRLLIEKHGIDISQDEDLQEMLKPTDVNRIEAILTREVLDK